MGEAGTQLRDRSRSVKLRVLDIARAARSKAKQGQEKLKRAYGQLLNSTGRVAGQAKRFSQEIAAGVKRAADVSRIDARLVVVSRNNRQGPRILLRIGKSGSAALDEKLWHLALVEVLLHGRAGRRPDEAENRQHFVLLDQLAHALNGLSSSTIPTNRRRASRLRRRAARSASPLASRIKVHTK